MKPWIELDTIDSRDPVIVATQPGGELSHELYVYMVDHMYDVAAAERRRSRWVMNDEWFFECVKIAGCPPDKIEYFLGLPFDVRDDGGVPHLEAAQ